MWKSSAARNALLTVFTAYVWIRALTRANGIADILAFSLAGVASAIALTWICWSFASVAFTRRTAVASAIAGVFLFTPLMYMLLTGYTDKIGSTVVLACTAAAVAAMAGAIWSVAHLVRSSLLEWKHSHSNQTSL